MPGTDIPIITPDELAAAKPDLVLVFDSELVGAARAALPEVERGAWVDAGVALSHVTHRRPPSGG